MFRTVILAVVALGLVACVETGTSDTPTTKPASPPLPPVIAPAVGAPCAPPFYVRDVDASCDVDALPYVDPIEQASYTCPATAERAGGTIATEQGRVTAYSAVAPDGRPVWVLCRPATRTVEAITDLDPAA